MTDSERQTLLGRAPISWSIPGMKTYFPVLRPTPAIETQIYYAAIQADLIRQN